MSNQVRTFDPKEHIITFGGVQLLGFADGTYLTVERDEDTFSKTIGADGFVVRGKSNNKSGSGTLTLLNASPSNTYLSGIMIADELNNTGVLPFLVKDLSGASTYFAANAWIRRVPSSEFSKEVTNREWIFDLASVDIFVAGIDAG